MEGSDDGSPRRPPRMTPLEQLRAIDQAFSEPHRLVDILSQAETYDEAAEALAREFGISVHVARVVMDQQVKRFTRQGAAGTRRNIARELGEDTATDSHGR